MKEKERKHSVMDHIKMQSSGFTWSLTNRNKSSILEELFVFYYNRETNQPASNIFQAQ